LLANASLTWSSHFCAGRLVKSSFSQNKEDLSCFRFIRTHKSDNTCTNSFSQTSCCENHFLTMYTDEVSLLKQSYDDIIAYILPIYYLIVVNQSEQTLLPIAKEVSPPLVKKHSQAYLQVFIV